MICKLHWKETWLANILANKLWYEDNVISQKLENLSNCWKTINYIIHCNHLGQFWSSTLRVSFFSKKFNKTNVSEGDNCDFPRFFGNNLKQVT